MLYCIKSSLCQDDHIDIHITGNMAEDFFVVLLLYPCAAYQMDQQMIDEGDYNISKKDDDFYMKDVTSIQHQKQPNSSHSPEVARAFSDGGRPQLDNEGYVINEMPRESIHL